MEYMKEKLMKRSIKYRLVIAATILIIFTVFLCWFANVTMLNGYYQHSKAKLLGSSYVEINNFYNAKSEELIENEPNSQEQENILKDFLNNAAEKEQMYDEISLALERMGSNKNMSIYVFDIYSTYGSNILLLAPNASYPRMTEREEQLLKERISKYYTNDSIDSKGKELLKTSKQYNIYRVYDTRMESNYIELFGRLDMGSTIYIRTNLESMQESVAISNKFLGYVGLISVLIGTFIMFFISRTFTRPILQLADIAKKMSDLDFDAKYDVVTEDEIGILGTSINSLSEKLEVTISELKTANNELQTDIEHKIQLDEMRKDFLSNVSHELKTPIALIQGYAEGLKENINEDEESRDFYCEVIVDEAVKMNKMVKKLLSLNQIEFGNHQVAFERFDITALIKDVAASTNILFQQKNATLQLEITEPVYVWTDEYMIEEVLTNYISNALNHVDFEKIIKINLVQEKEVVRISVFNTGVPIPEEELENIWIKFYKVDKARTREYGGNGIGLSIVKAIMTSMNRECGAFNHENGVEFWFELDSKI